MNDKPNPTEEFLVSLIASLLGSLLKPLWYAMRSHMGVRYTALIPIIVSCALCGACVPLLPWTGEVNRRVIFIYVALVAIGYVRNTIQARHRRRSGDWSVNTWSSGESLFVPVLLFVCRRVYRRWGDRPFVRRMIAWVLRNDSIYYFIEPAALALAAAALRSIGSTLFYYPLAMAAVLIVVRNDGQLWLYLKAHEIPDGKALERAITTEFQGAPTSTGSLALAEIPAGQGEPVATDSASVFERLSPDMQTLLMKDRYAHGEPLR